MFADRLKRLRKQAGITQKELAERLGMDRGRISMYEIGKRNPEIEVLLKISTFFGVSTDYLLGNAPYDKFQVNWRPGEKLGQESTANPFGIELSEEDIRILELFSSNPHLVGRLHQLAAEPSDIRLIDLELIRYISKNREGLKALLEFS